MKKLLHAIKKYLFKDTRYFFLYIFRYFQSNFSHACTFYTEEHFLQELEKGRSIIRLGDGEIGLLHFLKIHYQSYSDSIREDFLKIIRNYSDASSYIIMIPLFVNYSNKNLKEKGIFRCWMPLKLSYEMFFNKEATYFDQHIFYRDGKYSKLILPYLKKKKVLIVTNQKNRDFLKKTEFNDLVYEYILSPAENAYEERLTIKKEILEKINATEYSKKDFVIIMAAGLSKTIIYDLSMEGYQLLDIGKGLESYYKNESIENQI